MMSVYSLPVDVRELLSRDEKVIWYDKPVLSALMLKSLSMLIIGLPFLIFPLLIFGFTGGLNPSTFFVLIPFFAFWYGIVGLITIGPIIHVSLSWRNMLYLLTDKRIIVRQGAVGIDYEILDLENVQQVNLNVGFWDKVYGTGTITIHSIGVKPVSLYAIREPTRALMIIRRAVEERGRSNR
ncbi:MAG: hypothetical protein B6U94_08080 [Thermofilum sp. ex4484_79]|nr:MAG: hypothetical protein B6U94_08080 [Thermofilum sp. ex4484_79]